MSDHRERACTNCGSYLHHEDKCTNPKPEIEKETAVLSAGKITTEIDNAICTAMDKVDWEERPGLLFIEGMKFAAQSKQPKYNDIQGERK